MGLVEGFRDALSMWASGVSVVTARDEGGIYGLTVSSFASVSLDPPLVLVCIGDGNRIRDMIAGTGRFAVSLLADGQRPASEYFARTGRDPTPGFTVIGGEWTGAGLPVVEGAAAWLRCSLHNAHREGDHTIFVGRVEETAVRPDTRPLVYWRRAYRGVTE